jgi:glucose-1-phosphatase
MSTIKAVIFDWGGVVAPNNNGGWVKQLALLLDIDFESALKLWREFSPGLSTGKITEEDFWKSIQNYTGKQPPKDKSKVWQDGLAYEPYPEIIYFVKYLEINNIRTVILSNTIEPMEHIVDLGKMYKDFDDVFLSHRLGIAKPDPRMFKHALNELQLRPEECVFIDDYDKNVEVAKGLGFKVVFSDHDPKETIEQVKKYINK